MIRRLLALMARPWAPLSAALIGMIFSLPALGTGLVVDDYFHRTILLGVGPFGRGARPLLDLFAFVAQGPRREAALATGLLTWWAHPDLSASFLRPLSALTHVVDYAAWPDLFALQHLHSLVWYGLGVFAVARLYRQLHGATAVAGLGALFFAVDDAHAMCTGWLANRHALVAFAVGMAALHAHRRWRRSRRPIWALPAIGLFAAALFCSEAGLATVAYVVAWELTMEDGRWTNRMAALVPYGALIVAWHALYERLGYGTNGSGLYIDPGHQPVSFALALAERWPVLQLAQWFEVPSDAFLFVPRGWQIVWVVCAAVACLGLLHVFRPLLAARRDARFWAVGMCLALVPFCAVFPMDRLLLFSGVGAFALLALFVEYVGLLPGVAATPAAGRTIARVLVVLHGPMAALLLLVRVAALPLLNAPVAQMAVASTLPGADAGPITAVFVNGPDAAAVYLPILNDLEHRDPPIRRVAVLGSMFSPNVVQRESADTLAVTVPGGFLATSVDVLLRNPDTPFAVGERIERPDFTAEVRAVTPDGRPERVAFHFRAPLESPEYRWLVWKPTGLEAFRFPAAGSQVEIPAVLEVGRNHLEP